MSKKKFFWGLYGLIVAGLFIFTVTNYTAPAGDSAAELLRFRVLWGHLFFGIIPLLIGPIQLGANFQHTRPVLHKLLGRIYVTCILISGTFAIWLGLNSSLPLFGYALLGLDVVWWLTTGTAIYHIRKRQIILHRQWMVRSFLTTNAFIFFRMMIPPASIMTIGTLEIRFAVAATLSWIIPLSIYQWVLTRKRRSRPAAEPAAG